MPLSIDSWWGRLRIWSIHNLIYAMLLTSFHKLWLSLPSSFGRQESMYCVILEAHWDMDHGTDRRMSLGGSASSIGIIRMPTS